MAFLLQPCANLCYTVTMTESLRLNLYFPPESQELYEKIKYLAKKDLRSMNMECIALLTQMVEQRRDDLVDFEQEKKHE